MLLPALWFSVEVIQHDLPPLSSANASSDCSQRLRAHYDVNVAFAHASRAARSSLADSGPAGHAYAS